MAGGLGALVDPLVNGLVEVNGLEWWEEKELTVYTTERKEEGAKVEENH